MNLARLKKLTRTRQRAGPGARQRPTGKRVLGSANPRSVPRKCSLTVQFRGSHRRRREIPEAARTGPARRESSRRRPLGSGEGQGQPLVLRPGSRRGAPFRSALETPTLRRPLQWAGFCQLSGQSPCLGGGGGSPSGSTEARRGRRKPVLLFLFELSFGSGGRTAGDTLFGSLVSRVWSAFGLEQGDGG